MIVSFAYGFVVVADGVVLFEIEASGVPGETAESILLVFNAARDMQEIDPVACGVNMEMDKMLMVEPISAMIFVK